MGCNSSLAVDSCPIQSEDIFLSEYRLGKQLGAGKFGTVALATDSKSRVYAVKVLECDEALAGAPLRAVTRKFFKESSLLRRASGHKNVVGFHAAFGFRETHYIVMEACRCSVASLLKDRRLHLETLPRYFREMASGLAHCHAVGIVHRDVKPDNFVLGDANGEEIKLTDFGLAAVLPKNEMLYDRVGTSPYMSPELIDGSGYDSLTDVWSLGATVYVILFREYPFVPKEHTHDAMKELIKRGSPAPSFQPSSRAPTGDDFSENAVEFAKTLLNRDKTNRVSMTEVLALSYVDVANSFAAPREMASAFKSDSNLDSGSTLAGESTYSSGSCTDTSVSI